MTALRNYCIEIKKSIVKFNHSINFLFKETKFLKIKHKSSFIYFALYNCLEFIFKLSLRKMYTKAI